MMKNFITKYLSQNMLFISLILISALASFFILFIGEISFPGGASHFFWYSDAILHNKIAPEVNVRDIGYPLIILLSGYEYTHSIISLLIIQTLMACLMPILIYKMIELLNKKNAFIAAIITVLTLAPYNFMLWIHHDQTYMFFMIAGTYFSVAYLVKNKSFYLILAVLTLIFASLTRPAGNLLFLPLMFILILLKPADWGKHLLCVLVVILVWFAYSMHRNEILGINQNGNAPSYTGKQIFYNIYVNSGDFQINLNEIGPKTDRLFKILEDQVRQDKILGSKYVELWFQSLKFPQASRNYFYDRYIGNEEEFIKNIFKNPNQDYFEFLCLVVGKHNPLEEDRIFKESAIEIITSNPLYFIKITLRNLYLFMWDPGTKHGRFGVDDNSFVKEGYFILPYGANTSLGEVESLPAPAKYEIVKEKTEYIVAFQKWSHDNLIKVFNQQDVKLVNQFFIIISLFSIIGIIRIKNIRYVGLVAWIVYLNNAIVTSAFVDPDYRYYDMNLPCLIVLFGVGLCSIENSIKEFMSSVRLNGFNTRRIKRH